MSSATLTTIPAETAGDQTATSPGTSTRYHHLDAVRAFALLLGVFFHAAESFGPRNFYWAIVDRSTSELLENIRLACHSFRLELFFIIAGFFARLLIMRRGTKAFVGNRVQRILVPLVVGWALLYPIFVFIWLWGASVSGRLQQFGVPPEAANVPPWLLTVGFFLTGGFVERFDLTHLWFLHQLLVLYVVALGIRWIVCRVDRSGANMTRVDLWFGRMLKYPGTLYWLLLPSIPILLTMREWGIDTPKHSLWPHVPTTLLFGFFFLLGWLWHRQPPLLDIIARRWPWYMAVGVVSWLAFLFIGPRIHLTRLSFTLLYAHMMWGFVLGFLGLISRCCRRANPWTRYVADASYWIYIAHLPLVVALQVFFGRMDLPWLIKYPCICAITLTLLFLSYHYLVRGTFVGLTLNGRRYPRVWPWRARAAD